MTTMYQLTDDTTWTNDGDYLYSAKDLAELAKDWDDMEPLGGGVDRVVFCDDDGAEATEDGGETWFKIASAARAQLCVEYESHAALLDYANMPAEAVWGDVGKFRYETIAEAQLVADQLKADRPEGVLRYFVEAI